jgi:hypothetical protein
MQLNDHLAARTLAFVVADGEGRSLSPLTKYRPQSLIPFGGSYRMIDFALSNCLNSGIQLVYVLTQHESESIAAYLRKGWSRVGSNNRQFAAPNPPTSGKRYAGTPTPSSRTLHCCRSINLYSHSFSPQITFTRWIIASLSLPCNQWCRSDDCHDRVSAGVLNGGFSWGG